MDDKEIIRERESECFSLRRNAFITANREKRKQISGLNESKRKTRKKHTEKYMLFLPILLSYQKYIL